MEISLKTLIDLNRKNRYWSFKLGKTMTIRELLASKGFEMSLFKDVEFLVNGYSRDIDYQLQDGDKVVVIPLATGG